jgi:hypothetical protein
VVVVVGGSVVAVVSGTVGDVVGAGGCVGGEVGSVGGVVVATDTFTPPSTWGIVIGDTVVADGAASPAAHDVAPRAPATRIASDSVVRPFRGEIGMALIVVDDVMFRADSGIALIG